jgi:hypothetical protein
MTGSLKALVCPQVLRTRYAADEAGGLQQTVLPADAIGLQTAVAKLDGVPVPQTAAGFFAASDTSSTEWRAFATAPFDLFNDVLIRCKV